MSKNTDKKSDKKAVEITKKSITEQLDSVAVSVAEQDEKTKVTQTDKLLSLIGGNDKFAAATDSERRKLLDLCIAAINERIGELKAENKALPKGERKPLKESQLWQGLRSLLGLASAMRSKLRTQTEKDAASQKAEKARRETEAKILEKAIQAGKVILPSDDIPNIKTCGSAEEIIFSVYAQLTENGITVKDWLRMTKACTLAE